MERGKFNSSSTLILLRELRSAYNWVAYKILWCILLSVIFFTIWPSGLRSLSIVSSSGPNSEFDCSWNIPVKYLLIICFFAVRAAFLTQFFPFLRITQTPRQLANSLLICGIPTVLSPLKLSSSTEHKFGKTMHPSSYTGVTLLQLFRNFTTAQESNCKGGICQAPLWWI